MDTLMSFRLPSEMIAHLDTLAEEERRSRGFLVRIALEDFLAKHPIEKKKPKSQPKKKQNGKDSLTPA
jgi:predicted transcriptional regulator